MHIKSIMDLSPKDLERFWARVDQSGKCWLWLGARTRLGYGRFYRRSGGVYAHRASYILAYGDVPPGLYVCHRCDNPPCVNPAHLFAGTAKQNTLDMLAKGRAKRGGGWTDSARAKAVGKYAHGETHHWAKLTTAQVTEIRQRYERRPGVAKALAAEYGVDRNHICRIVRGAIWTR